MNQEPSRSQVHRVVSTSRRELGVIQGARSWRWGSDATTLVLLPQRSSGLEPRPVLQAPPIFLFPFFLLLFFFSFTKGGHRYTRPIFFFP